MWRFCESFQKMLPVAISNIGRRRRSSCSLVEAEIQRKKKLARVYAPAFKNLNTNERRSLAFSGKVWWEMSEIAVRPIDLSSSTISRIDRLEDSAKGLKNHDPFQDRISPVWNAFREAMTHHSTAMEGNTLSRAETAIALDHFGDGIARGIGISESDDLDQEWLQQHDFTEQDVKEVVNHAAAMEFVKKHLFEQTITVDLIQQVFDVLMPHNTDWFDVQSTDLSPTHGIFFRRLPIRVRGSPSVRPYPHEVPELMNKVLHVYHNKHLKELPPVVADILFMMNFLYVHPFQDGNGRVSRLLLQTMLYNHGLFGCILPVSQKQRFFSHFTPYFESNASDGVIDFVLRRIEFFHDALKEYEEKKNAQSLFDD